jgi:hypothetical protein
MNTLEKTIQKKIIKRLREIPYCYFFVKEAAAIKGIPDIVGHVNGHFFALEVKKNKAAARETKGRAVLQRYEIAKIRSKGGQGWFIYPENMDEVLEKIRVLSDYPSLYPENKSMSTSYRIPENIQIP